MCKSVQNSINNIVFSVWMYRDCSQNLIETVFLVDNTNIKSPVYLLFERIWNWKKKHPRVIQFIKNIKKKNWRLFGMIELADKFDFEIDLHNDNDLPVSFNKTRHEGAINSSNAVSKSWRIRDRVSR